MNRCFPLEQTPAGRIDSLSEHTKGELVIIQREKAHCRKLFKVGPTERLRRGERERPTFSVDELPGLLLTHGNRIIA